MIRVSAVVLYL